MPSMDLTYGFLSGSRKEATLVGVNMYFTDQNYLLNTRSLGLDFNVITKPDKRIYLIFSPSISKDLLHSENSLIIGINGSVMINILSDK